MTEKSDPGSWTEETSQDFIAFGDIFTPARSELFQVIASLIPARTDEGFVVVELSSGAGILTRAILDRFSHCRVIDLDYSPTMLEEARKNAGADAARAEFRIYDLARDGWRNELPSNVRCFVSSLAIHHLDAVGKRRLFGDLASRLPEGGALLIADLVEPVNERTRRLYARQWDDAVREQSQSLSGSLDAYEEFRRQEWNHYVTPDLEFDRPSGLLEQLHWLSEAGFSQVDCFWLRAGHAIYGGYK